MKTSELNGAALDWAVAKIIAIGEDQLSALHVKRGRPFLLVDGGNPYGPARACNFSTDWSLVGPILEREGISVINTHGTVWAATTYPAHQIYQGHTDAHFQGVGPTPLIAAMRCYVTVKLGDEVELPKELI